MTSKLIEENIVEAHIAIVLTDIIGSTKFVQKNGSHVAAKWFGVHDKAVMNFIARNNGQLVDASDGHLMYFGTIQDAISFAFMYKEYLRKNRFPFKSRVGIHWDKMLIVKSEEHLVRAGGKRINLEGLGKNIAARTMSICGPEQILISKNAYFVFKQRTKRNRNIPKDAKIALAGLYQFKGVSRPEQIYVLGTIESHMQPPPSGEKVTRIGGKKKIKVRLRNKRIRDIIWYFFKRLFFINFIYLFWLLIKTSGTYHGNYFFHKLTGIDLSFFLGWLYNLIFFLKGSIEELINYF